MAVTDAMLMNHGYGYYGSYAQYRNPIVTDPEAQRINARTGQIFLVVFLGLIGIVVVVAVAAAVRNR
jgi:hypothetical protein